MKTFTRDDRRVLRVIEGYRNRLLSQRPGYTPRPDWGDEQYAAAAKRKVKRTRGLLDEFARWGGRIAGARVLDVACGDGINCLLIGLQPVQEVVGIDLELPLLERVPRFERTRRLASAVCKEVGLKSEIDEVLGRLPVRLLKMNATAMQFGDNDFDLLVSRSAIEHIMPAGKVFAEMARVVRPGGLVHLSTDPYFSPQGCHKTGVVDIPFAHARLSLKEYRRFVTESEGESRARERCQRLETLNPFTIRQWREMIEANPFEIREWCEEPSPIAETLLAEYPEVIDTVREGVDYHDVVHARLKMWLRKRSDA